MDILLETKDLLIEYKSIEKNNSPTVLAVNNVTLKIFKGEIYALAGESGCGKSSLAKSLVKLLKPTSGDILFKGKSILTQTKLEQKKYPQQVQMIFQNPYSSLNPKMKIKDILSEPLDINTSFTREEKNNIIKKVSFDETHQHLIERRNIID